MSAPQTFAVVIALCAAGRLLAVLIASKGAVNEDTVDVIANRLNQFAIGVCFPAVILKAAPALKPSADLAALAITPWFLLGAVLIVAVIGSQRGVLRPTATAVALSVGFGNTAFLGYAVIPAVRGESALPLAVVSDQLGSFLSLSTIGLVAISVGAGKARPSVMAVAKRMLLFPPFIALCVGVTIMPTIPPAPFDLVIAWLGKLLLPTAALAIGLRLRVPRTAAVWRPLSVIVVAKLLLMPTMALALCLAVGVDDSAGAVVVMQAAMPTMMTVGALLALAGVAVELSTAAVTVTTLVSMLTLPLWSALLAWLWPV